MNSSQQASPNTNLGEAFSDLFTEIQTAWQKAKDRQTPEQKKVTEEFWKEAKKPKTWAEFALMITVITALKKKRGWGKTKTLLAFLVTNVTWSYIEDPERYKRAYKAAIHR